jgi:hypothetical protein
MAWIGQRDQDGGQFSLAGLDMAPIDVDWRCALQRGTVMVEYRHIPADIPVNLVRFMARDPYPAALTLRSDPCGTLRLLMRSGAQDGDYDITLPQLIPGETVILRYCWDALADTGILAVSIVEREQYFTVPLDGVVPLTVGSAQQLVMAPLCQLAAQVTYLAIADDVVAVGPMPGLDGRSRVMTPRGAVPIRRLVQGDIVMACDGAQAQVRWAGQLTVPAMGVFQPVMLRAPYYGVHQDLALNGEQRLHLQGSEVEYLFAETEVAVRVRDLVDNRSVVNARAGPLVTYHHMMIDRPVPLLVEGVVVPGFDPTAILADPLLAAQSVLADLPQELIPRRAAPERSALHRFEAQTLRRMRVA